MMSRRWKRLAGVACALAVAGCTPGGGKVARSTGHGTSVRPLAAEQVVALGESVEGRAITMHVFGGASAGESVLIFGGFHGNEPTSTDVARSLIAYLRANPGATQGRRVAIVPAVNPDGLHRNRRTNANGVDVNRNFPASNWSRGERRGGNYGGASAGSEPETQAVFAAVRRVGPARIVSIHSIARGRRCNNYDGPGEALARAMARHNGYRVTPTMGYATPGSFGTWSGIDAGRPTITLELPRDASGAQCWAENREALLAFIANGELARGSSLDMPGEQSSNDQRHSAGR